ncbi:voltage-gated chloride channel [Alteromonas mediterranea]|jgi:H+/Cl- antiporter ClcA|uniref:Voltage-gated chloride channel n=1 Tax=Alteromonas mediterranea TaxID=314275 RepID=A0AAC8XLC3_9ALTE|nr:chloride channel protein [Alteromonas mediterranea]MBR9785162.1 chloride channel protein [Gammaproteobacteria bacterium]AFV86662.1 putative Voltage-gated ClC-type chloride channel clcA [Alteromonas mediterranea DE1]AGP98675.1 Voltage-gated ClC-type chloride channel clcA [Alteromonas mediterranea UM7]AMJ79618.1 voltage-gated chloride channel [Alteromonas mediterranea]AMJ83775.1 voltage-gated chloride channel [Alteromonas mediterranea]
MRLQALREEVAHPRTSIQLCMLGIVGGTCAALIIILFRLCVEWLQETGVSSLQAVLTYDWLVWLIMPFISVGLILFIAFLTGFKHYRLGIPFVIHRVKYYYGYVPLRTTINQFFGGMLALAGGFVVGREGPSVHMGASGSSFLGQWLRLPYNSIRILAGCGIAAGISASFNTPFAAVIFVMEVVLREYKIHIFVPIMLAAACGSVLTRIVFGEVNELSFLSFNAFSQWMYFYLVLLGVLLGMLAVLFNSQLMRVMTWFRPVSMVWRLVLAALITGTIGMFIPEALGANFIDVEHLFDSSPGALLLVSTLIFKVILAVFAIGLGIPGGIIGPVMVIGMLAGAVLLLPLSYFINVPEFTNSFALLGIAGMLTAVLHAPLAALSAVMELSYSPQIILPAMLVIVPAYVTSTQFFGNRSIFIRQLDYQNLPYAISSIREALEKTGVLAAMNTEYKLFHDAPEAALFNYLESNPTKIVIQKSKFEIDVQYKLVQYNVSLEHDASALNYYDMEGISAQSTLHEVYEHLKNSRSGAVYIYDQELNDIIGVVTWNILQSFLQKAHY